MDEIVRIEDLEFDYTDAEGAVLKALKGVSLSVPRGGFVAIIGRNGSGKSTLAKNINALLLPTKGAVYVDGMRTTDEDKIWDIRQTAGMVFQNPDNQIVASVVEDDVAFGLENMGVPSEEIQARVDEALQEVGMYEHKKRAPHLLSGGQKQRIAIAGVVAMRPKCIVFDEPTAMLDPQGRTDIRKAMRKLKEEGITIILITHFMEEAVAADHIIILSDGAVALEGTAEEVFAQPDKIKALGLRLPLAVELGERLRARGIDIPRNIIKKDQMVEYLCQLK